MIGEGPAQALALPGTEEPTPRPKWSHHKHPVIHQCEIAECRELAFCVYESRTARWVCPDCADAWDEDWEEENKIQRGPSDDEVVRAARRIKEPPRVHTIAESINEMADEYRHEGKSEDSVRRMILAT